MKKKREGFAEYLGTYQLLKGDDEQEEGRFNMFIIMSYEIIFAVVTGSLKLYGSESWSKRFSCNTPLIFAVIASRMQLFYYC